MEELEESVFLYVYDLSNGMASQWGQALTGRRIDGIWHTSIVLYGMEVFYGQGISVVRPPGTSHHGKPLRKMSMGTTALDRETVIEYLEGLKSIYTADRYHLLDFNCNSFTNDLLGFLTGGSIPEEIRSTISHLPRDILATPFGQQMRPMIDQMFSGRLGSQANSASSFGAESNFINSSIPSTQSLSSNLHICTSTASLSNLLASNTAVVVMFTSDTGEACRHMKKVLEELARHYTADRRGIQFALVEKNIGEGPTISGESKFGGPIRKFPTFVCFARGIRFASCDEPDTASLKSYVLQLQSEVYPAHPHDTLIVAGLSKLTKNLAPVTYTTFPAISALSEKLDAALDSGSLSQPQTRIILKKVVLEYLSSLCKASAIRDAPFSHEFFLSWISATQNALDSVSFDNWFPIIDIWRLAVGCDSVRLSTSPPVRTFLPGLVQRLALQVEAGISPPLLLTTIRLISNMLISPDMTQHLLDPVCTPAVTMVAVRSLLDPQESMRRAGAGLTWSLVSRCWVLRGRGDYVPGEDWQVELASAALEALDRESESAEVVHRLAATLGFLVFQSPDYEVVRSALRVLGVKEVLDRKRQLVESNHEAVAVLDDVEHLCL